MPARRKLFLTHAGELAHLLVSAIARDGLTMEFVRGYAKRHERIKVIANVERLREMESTISREALLLIASEIRPLLPRAFGFGRSPRPEELALCDVFYTEFLGALGRALEWPLTEAEIEAEAFRKDLDTYTKWHRRDAITRATRMGSKDGSPFPDRCAILLDSAMMEQARRAAGRFQSDLLRLGTRIFDRLGRPPLARRAPRAKKAGPDARTGQPRTATETNRRSRSLTKLAKSGSRAKRRRH